MLLVLVFCAALGYLANKAHDNERLIAQAGRKFAVVEFQEWGPDWLRNWVGARYFREPVALYVPRDFAENCLPLLEEYPSIKRLGVIDTPSEKNAFDLTALESQVDRLHSDVRIIGLSHLDNWGSIRARRFDKSEPECRQLAELIVQASLKWPMMREGFEYQTFTISVADEERQLWLLLGEQSVALLAKGDRLIDHVAVSNFYAAILPVVVDADADGSPDVGFCCFDATHSSPRKYSDNFHRISLEGCKSVSRSELCEKYVELTTIRFHQD